MEAEHTLTTYDFWKNTIHTVESAYCWLKLCEGKNYELIDESIASLRELITHGKDYEAMKSYKSASSSTITTTATTRETAPATNNTTIASASSSSSAAATTATTTTTTTVKQAVTNNWKKSYNPPPVSWNLESNWEQVDANTIKVHFENGMQALCIAVTTPEELDQAVQEIYSAKSIAVDCEFLGQKNQLPELKLLQVGVSKDKGFAIQVDLIGQDIITDKLKPIFEDQKMDIVGWSFRGDALAIEAYIKQTDLSPVLDLQAKLKLITVETLNLGNAMNKYASTWYGHSEFQRAKQYGGQFHFTDEHCVWLYNPLPPKALVYAVFDVLSLIALHECTGHHESPEKAYWPFTVLSESSPKAVERWHRQRAKAIDAASSLGGGNSNNGAGHGMVGIVRPSFKKNGTGRASSLSSYGADEIPNSVLPTTISTKGDGYNDDDVRYKSELQMALERCVADAYKRNGESSTSDRIVSEEQLDYNALAAELNEHPYNNDNARHFTAQGSSGDKQGESSKQQQDPIVEATWGLEVLDDQPFIGHKFAAASFDNGNASWTTTETTVEQQQQQSSPTSPAAIPASPVAAVVPAWPSARTTTSSASHPSPSATKSPSITKSPAASRTIASSTATQSPPLTKLPLKQPAPIPLSSPYLKDKPLYKPPLQTTSSSPPSIKNTSVVSRPKSLNTDTTTATTATRATTSNWNNNATANLSQWGDKSKNPAVPQEWNESSSQQGWGSQNASEQQWGSSELSSQQAQWGSPSALLHEGGKSDNSSSNWNTSDVALPSSSNTNNTNNQCNNSLNTTPTTQNAYTNNNSPRQCSRSSNTPRSRPSSGIYQQQHQQQASPSPSTMSASSPPWNPSNTSLPQLQQQQSSKPDKGKYTNDFKNRITMNGQQTGSFTWAKPKSDEMSAHSWSSFASNSVKDWDQGKDTDLIAISSPAAMAAAVSATTTTITTTTTVTKKFNTSVSNYTQGGQTGNSATGQMHNREEDNWTRKEERPDTMTMSMNQIPIRTKFSGPRIINPNDADFVSDNDDEDDDNQNDDSDDDQDVDDLPSLKMSSTATVTAQPDQPAQSVEKLPTFVDDKFLYSDDGNGELAMLKLTKPEHLDMIEIPEEGYTVTVCFHFVPRNNTIELKALQLYLSTGASYTAIIEQACLLKDRQHLKQTKFGHLLTDPNVKRICWCPDFIEEEMMVKLGFVMGGCIDLSQFANFGRDDTAVFSFISAINHYLREWKDKDQFLESKKDFEQSSGKKFSGTLWDREKLPHNVLEYCALQGLAAHQLYVETKRLLNPPEQDFIYYQQA